MTTKHQVSRLEIYVAWKQTKNVLKDSPVLGHFYNTAYMYSKIRRIWVGLILLKESVGINQHVEYWTVLKFNLKVVS